jgi:hypothetical protein
MTTQVMHSGADELEVQRRDICAQHRKHSSNGRRSRIHGRHSGGVHRQGQKIFQSESSQSVSEKKGEIRWQQAKRRNTGEGISR